MTKKEQAELDGLRKQIALLNAFHFTPEVEPDIAAPTNFSDCVLGWSFNSYSSRVCPTWSKYSSNGDGHEHTRHGAQGGTRQYSSEVLALKALRHALEQKFASELAAVDARIAKVSEVVDNPSLLTRSV